MPMSPLYLFFAALRITAGRTRAIQRRQDSQHLRLWKRHFHRQRPTLWVGAATHDIGFRTRPAQPTVSLTKSIRTSIWNAITSKKTSLQTLACVRTSHYLRTSHARAKTATAVVPLEWPGSDLKLSDAAQLLTPHQRLNSNFYHPKQSSSPARTSARALSGKITNSLICWSRFLICSRPVAALRVKYSRRSPTERSLLHSWLSDFKNAAVAAGLRFRTTCHPSHIDSIHSASPLRVTSTLHPQVPEYSHIRGLRRSRCKSIRDGVASLR